MKNTLIDNYLSENYKSKSQISRIITENWVAANCYCPICGNDDLSKCSNNASVKDFICPNCNSEFELKSLNSKNKGMGSKIIDGAYKTMIERINSQNNPHFIFMSRNEFQIYNMLIIPNYYFTDNIIEKRKPLSQGAKRKGWTGCNIMISQIPESGRIYLIRNQDIINKNDVVTHLRKTLFLKDIGLSQRGWIFALMNLLNRIKDSEFKLDDVYQFENVLKMQFPDNNNIKPKIRQILQQLREKEYLEFLGNGKYKKI